MMISLFRETRPRGCAALLLTILLLFSAPAIAGSTFDLLRVDASPRGAALGSHSIALLGGDISALSAHPAGLALLQQRELAASYSDHPLDVAGGRFSYGFPFEIGYGALSLTYLNYGSFDRRAELDDDKEGSFTPNDLQATLAFAVPLPHGISVGASAHFIRSQIDTYTSTGLGADVSAHWVTGWKDVELAAGASNLGTQLTAFNETRENLPSAVHVGLAKQLAHLPLKLGLTGHADSDQTVWGTLAGEFTVSPLLKLRAGYSSLAPDYAVGGSDDTFAGLSAGLGISYMDARLDYAFHSQGALGQVHRLGFAYRF